MKGGCTHGTHTSHTVKDEGKWICSVCKRKFEWNDHSRYYGAPECGKCGLPVIHAVACSDACQKKIVIRRGKVVSPAPPTETISFEERK